MNGTATHSHLVGRRAFVALAGTVAASLATGSACGTPFAHAENANGNSGQEFVPGTYKGRGRGRKGWVDVSAKIGEKAIESIELVHHIETPRIVQAAFAGVAKQVLDLQSLNVDTVSGATMSSNAIIDALASCVEQAGGDPDLMREGPTAEKQAASAELEGDVIIVGSGAAGSTAACACAMKGARVIVFEANGYIGGNSLISGGVIQQIEAPEEMRAPMTDGLRAYFEQTVQDSAAAGYPQDVIDQLLADYDAYYATGTDRVYNSVAWETMYSIVSMGTTYSPELYDLKMEFNSQNPMLFDWFNELGIVTIPQMSIGGFPWPDWTLTPTGEGCDGFFQAFEAKEQADGLDVTVLLSTPVQGILVEDGTVVGVRGTSADGTVYTAHAPYVVMATGGFSGGHEMCVEHDDEWGFADCDVIPTTNNCKHDGSALRMAMQAGAVMKDASPNFMMMPFANGVDYSIESMIGASGSVPLVNAEGRRFVDETKSRNDINKALMKEPEKRCFQISDSTNCGLERKSEEVVDQLLEDRKGFRADSLEELAELMGVDPTTFVGTIDDFNACCETGIDDTTGRVVFTGATISKPPFYASPMTWATHITQGGLAYDSGTYALLDEAGEKIPGFYGIGECIYWGGSNMVMSSGVYLANELFG